MHTMNIMRRHHSGFTLIELLVVIAIIAILAAILFPVFAAARVKAQAVTCLSAEKQLAYGQQMYLDDVNGYFPTMMGYIQYDPAKFPNQPGWFAYYHRYIKSRELTRCPAAKPLPAGWLGHKVLNEVDYILSSVICSYFDSSGKWHGVRNSAIKSPAKTITMYDLGFKYDDLDPTDEWGDRNADDGGKGCMWCNNHVQCYPFLAPDGVHSGGYNVAVADCHVKFIRSWNPEVLHRGYWKE